MGYIPLREAVKRLGLHKNTLRKYADNGSIPSIRNPAGQRLFDVEADLGASAGSATICYCRVSSNKQRDDLARQVAYMQSLYPQAEIVSFPLPIAHCPFPKITRFLDTTQIGLLYYSYKSKKNAIH